MEDKTVVSCVALIMLAIIEVCALTQDIDGQLLMVVLVIVAGAVGVPIGLCAKQRLNGA